MIDPIIEAFGHQFGYNKHVESIMHYPHPFTDGGIILVCGNNTADFLDLLADVYAHQLPSLSLHCLRRRELFQLSLPGLFAPPLQINERPHLPYWLKHKGTVLSGIDLRAEIVPTVESRVLLAGHIEGCMDYLRRYGILTALIHDKGESLVNMLAQEMLYLMGTALLLYEVWDVSSKTVAAQFAERFPHSSPWQIWQRYQQEQEVGNVMPESVTGPVWLFEQFLYSLRAYTQ